MHNEKVEETNVSSLGACYMRQWSAEADAIDDINDDDELMLNVLRCHLTY